MNNWFQIYQIMMLNMDWKLKAMSKVFTITNIHPISLLFTSWTMN